MNPRSIVVHKSAGRPEQLILLFHGVGATPEGLVPLGQRLASAFPNGTVVSVAAPHASDISTGYQWFAVPDITEVNRVARVAAAMPAFLDEVGAWQKALEVTATVTALVGFSQGAIMALESSVTQTSPAGRVVAIAGRFAKLPDAAPSHTTIHLVHGKEDAVIPYRHAIDAAHRLRELGGDVTADLLPFAGHEINAAMAELVVERLLGHVPKRIWDEALQAEKTFPRPQ